MSDRFPPPALPRRDAWENPREVGGGRVGCTWSGWLELAELLSEVAQELKQRVVLGGGWLMSEPSEEVLGRWGSKKESHLMTQVVLV